VLLSLKGAFNSTMISPYYGYPPARMGVTLVADDSSAGAMIHIDGVAATSSRRIEIRPQEGEFAVSGYLDAGIYRLVGSAHCESWSVDSLPSTSTASTEVVLTLPQPPKLTIAREAESLLLSWPTNTTGFVLQMSDGSLAAANWSDIPEIPRIDRDRFVLTKAPADWSRFYRLERKP
jgi:hypothetical protein